ncbi:uncharacterized protein LOC123912757 [Trifolium pratense]|uniref:Uncharacterized protein n=1 Tax=Trifolium pratense TaxID=57577 RepID=A0ACB0M8F6_TRIPR|nr:uncharacterized protein LOC123912757 [Trifolium pratense]CAJ2678156.1 unnamed protein product [Trifolium pratense]
MGKQFFQGGRVGFNFDAFLIIKVPDARFLRILSQFLFLALVFVVFPFLCSFLKGLLVPSFDATVFVTASSSVSINVDVLNSILHDLGDEGLLKKEHKALIMSPPVGFQGGASLLNWNSEVDLVMHESYDFVFTTSFEDAVSADRVLKINGVVAFPLSVDDSSDAGFRKQSNYKVVYLRRYDSIFVALRKIGLENRLVDNSPKRRLCQFATVARMNALKGLEDALLEPPRQDSDESNTNLKINYLPELMGDSLEGYKRRVFIGVGLHDENKAAIEWFERNYPKKGMKFQIHSLQVALEEPDVPQNDFSAWLSKHVREDEYVVMKAEANVVEEMMRKKTICLVDELFLQCNNEWWQTGKRKNSGRAYWECLALYGRLIDEGVAVHQWWD